jgi:hypothetical protein
MHIKLIPPDSYDFSDHQVQLMKVSSRGLRGYDLSVLEKRAGAQAAHEFAKLAWSPGEEPIHLIALGATEAFRANRNFDAWCEQTCRSQHPTFVKFARFYRHHRNRDPKISFGVVKHSLYNHDMKRIELAVGLNATKEAAASNKGLVADEEMQKLATDLDNFAVSMSCRVPYDVCQSCGNKAKTRAEYCLGVDEGGTCPGGGCRHKLGAVSDDGDMVYVENPGAEFFDISRVHRPACRVAYVLGPLSKAASAIKGGAALAEEMGLICPLVLAMSDTTDPELRRYLKVAYDLADLEETAAAVSIPTPRLAALPDIKELPQALRALATYKIAMGLPDFLRVATTCTDQEAQNFATQVAAAMPGVFGRLRKDADNLMDQLRQNPFRAAKSASDTTLMWAARQSEASLDYGAVQRRMWKQAMVEQPTTSPTSQVTVGEAAEGLARAYALYKIAFLGDIVESDPQYRLTSQLVLGQNDVTC